MCCVTGKQSCPCFVDGLPTSARFLPGDRELLEEDREPKLRHPHHTTRPGGGTARFYKHRRSASMSSYDTRSFKRGDQLYSSEGRGQEQRSTSNHYSAQRKNVRASVREGTEVGLQLVVMDRLCGVFFNYVKCMQYVTLAILLSSP